MSYRGILNDAKNDYFKTPMSHFREREAKLSKWMSKAAATLKQDSPYSNHLFLAHFHMGLAWEQRHRNEGDNEKANNATIVWREQLESAENLLFHTAGHEKARLYQSLSQAFRFDNSLSLSQRNLGWFFNAKKAAIEYGAHKMHDAESGNYLIAKDAAELIGKKLNESAWYETAGHMMQANAWINNFEIGKHAPHYFERAGNLFIAGAKKVNITESHDKLDYATHLISAAIQQYSTAAEIEIDANNKKLASPYIKQVAQLGKVRADLTRDTNDIQETIDFIVEYADNIPFRDLRHSITTIGANLEMHLREIQHPSQIHSETVPGVISHHQQLL